MKQVRFDLTELPFGTLSKFGLTQEMIEDLPMYGRDIEADFEQLKLTGGYDHNFCIDDWDGSLKHIATAKGPKSGRVMKVYTTLPGVQFYAGNFIAPEEGKAGAVYDNRTGFALETQYYPDTIHHENFPSYIFGGENGDYDSVTVYKFE